MIDDLYMTAMGIIGEKPLTDELLEQVIAALRMLDPNRPESDFIGLKKRWKAILASDQRQGIPCMGAIKSLGWRR